MYRYRVNSVIVSNHSLVSSYQIQQLPLADRPRERLLQHGAEALAATELLAIIMGNGTKGKSVLQLSQELLMYFGSLQRLAEASIEELRSFKGIGYAKAIQVKAALALASKLSRQDKGVAYQIRHPIHAYQLLKEKMLDLKQEHFVTILLNTKAHVIQTETISIGTLSQTLVHPRDVFLSAIKHCACSIIVAHNHPSGDPTPSQDDLDITQQLIEAGKILNIPINDHIIIGRDSYHSLREHSNLFSKNGP